MGVRLGGGLPDASIEYQTWRKSPARDRWEFGVSRWTILSAGLSPGEGLQGKVDIVVAQRRGHLGADARPAPGHHREREGHHVNPWFSMASANGLPARRRAASPARWGVPRQQLEAKLFQALPEPGRVALQALAQLGSSLTSSIALMAPATTGGATVLETGRVANAPSLTTILIVLR